jgi:tRNA modification GTPase
MIIDLLFSSISRFQSVLGDQPCVTSARHRSHIERCLSALLIFSSHIENDDIVLAAEELRQALLSLGRITGKVDIEQLLDIMFRDFCIGK